MNMTQRAFRIGLILLAVTGFVADQTSKYGIFRWLYQHPELYDDSGLTGSYEMWPGKFRLYAQYTRVEDPNGSVLRTWSSSRLPRVNHGALFGLGNQHEHGANWFFAIVSVVAGVAIVVWSFRQSTQGDRLLCVSLGLILAGTIGNLYDRLIFGGVRDFLYWYGYGIDWPVFNIADCCLVIGAVALVVHAFFAKPAPSAAPASTTNFPSPQVASTQ